MSDIKSIRLGDVGTTIEITLTDDGVLLPVTGSDTLTIKFRKTDNTSLIVAAVLSSDGTDAKIKYTTLADDIDVLGEWMAQAFIGSGTGQWHTEEEPIFTVEEVVV